MGEKKKRMLILGDFISNTIVILGSFYQRHSRCGLPKYIPGNLSSLPMNKLIMAHNQT